MYIYYLITSNLLAARKIITYLLVHWSASEIETKHTQHCKWSVVTYLIGDR